jgi:hypothetical protein
VSVGAQLSATVRLKNVGTVPTRLRAVCSQPLAARVLTLGTVLIPLWCTLTWQIAPGMEAVVAVRVLATVGAALHTVAILFDGPGLSVPVSWHGVR